MRECRFCKKPLEEEDTICTFCGYDPKTDTISPSFRTPTTPSADSGKGVEGKEKKVTRPGTSINPRVKTFAFVGLSVIVFSMLYRYNLNLNSVVSEMRYTLVRIKASKFLTGKFNLKKDKAIEKIELINVRSFEAPKKAIRPKDLVVEGIFFDPKGKSYVTINGKVFSEGETRDNITVKKINTNSVEVITEGKSKIIEVK